MIPKRLITAPAAVPVSAGEVRAQLRRPVLDTTLDEQIALWIPQATAYVEEQSGRRRITQTWEARFPGWQEVFRLPFGWLNEVVSIKYLDEDGAEQVYDPANYSVNPDVDPGQVVLLSDADLPSLYELDPIIIQFKCGSDIARQNAKSVILHVISDYYTYGRIEDEAFTLGLISAFKRSC